MYIHAKEMEREIRKKFRKFKKKLENMLQISPGMEERERKKRKKKFWGVIPKGWGIGMPT